MDRACARAARTGQRFYLYGGRNQGALAAARAQPARCAIPGLKIVGGYAPPFRELTDAEEERGRGRHQPLRRRRRVGRHRRAQAGEVDGADARPARRARADRRRRRVRLPRRPGAAGAAGGCSASASSGCSGCARSRAACGGATCATTRASCWASRASTAAAGDPRATLIGRMVRRAGALLAALVAALGLAGPRAPTSSTTTPRPLRAAAATCGSSPAPPTARSSSATGPDAAWTDWASLGGERDLRPGRRRLRLGRCYVFVRGADGAIYQNTYADGSWSGWASLGGYATSAPAAHVRRGPRGYVDLAVRGGDNAIWLPHLRARAPAGRPGARSAAT